MKKIKALFFGFSKWKHNFTRLIFKDRFSKIYFCDEQSFFQRVKQVDVVVIWGYSLPENLYQYLIETKIKVLYMEDGFLRSNGLGVLKNLPSSFVLDDLTPFFNPEKPSRLELLLNESNISNNKKLESELQSITERQLTKYSFKSDTKAINLRTGRDNLLVVGQVEDDMSIKLGSVDINTNEKLVRHVREVYPKANIIYKTHPDVLAGKRTGLLSEDCLRNCVDIDASHHFITVCLENCDSVHTITSLTGFEALQRGIPVHTYGKPFYSSWGLTEDRYSIERRSNEINLMDLVYTTLAVYPTYFCWDALQEISLSEFLERLEKIKNITPRESLYRSYKIALLGRLVRMLDL